MAALDTTSVSKPILSAYVASLDSQTKTCYVDKISTIGYIPHDIQKAGSILSSWSTICE